MAKTKTPTATNDASNNDQVIDQVIIEQSIKQLETDANEQVLNTSFKNLGVQCFLSSAKKLDGDSDTINSMTANILTQLRDTNSITEFTEYTTRMIKNVSNKKIELSISFKKVDLIVLRDYLINEHRKFLIIKESKLISDIALQFKLNNTDTHNELKIKLAKIMTVCDTSKEFLFGFNTKNSLKVYSFINAIDTYINAIN